MPCFLNTVVRWMFTLSDEVYRQQSHTHKVHCISVSVQMTRWMVPQLRWRIVSGTKTSRCVVEQLIEKLLSDFRPHAERPRFTVLALA